MALRARQRQAPPKARQRSAIGGYLAIGVVNPEPTGGPVRRQFPHARNRPYRPARDCLSRNWRAHRCGAAGNEPPIEHALDLNLLAPWRHSLERASSYLIELLPAFTGTARQLLFEHSPGRGNPKFTADFTAFDALIRYSDGQGRNGFVAFELKYSESMREPLPELKPRYDELSDASGLFTDPAAAALRANPLAQFWREHLLAQSMIANGLYDEGYFVVIAPALNYHVQDAAEAYQAQLREPEDGKVRFANFALEDVIETIRLSDQEHAEALHRRYCDFWLVDGELELNAPRFGLPAKRSARKPASAPEDAANPIPVETPPKRRVSRAKPKTPAAD
ncbi:MAG: hypothetical protein WA624_23390 [Methylocella sp.]